MRLSLFVLLWVWAVMVQGEELPPWVSPEGHDDPRVGMVLDTANGIWLTPPMLVESLASAAHVLVGEKHDNPDHHRLQLWLLQQLHGRRPQGSLLMEMIEPTQQAAVDHLQGELPQTETALESQLDWRAGWDWALYGPLVRWGLTQPERLLAANLTEEEIRGIYDAPPPRSSVYGAAAVELLSQTISSSHCGKLPEDQVPAMFSVQQARDEQMVEQLVDAPAPAMLLAGNFHVRKDVGVPLHWPADGLPAPLVVMLVEVGGDLPDRAQADFVWLTAGLPVQDYCAQWD